ncbi:hypothetical protein LSH36_569g02037 [Paralvinella palmiformis]|uniref:Uncharacterized protein n=1 Tax=Paralvinella palmiformis TaxID=53620 RepID=A0AAD9J617_9ANNE|nr:hypothetical protein LSH36_569g02037 [Paralvinella palmiformis]
MTNCWRETKRGEALRQDDRHVTQVKSRSIRSHRADDEIANNAPPQQRSFPTSMPRKFDNLRHGAKLVDGARHRASQQVPAPRVMSPSMARCKPPITGGWLLQQNDLLVSPPMMTHPLATQQQQHHAMFTASLDQIAESSPPQPTNTRSPNKHTWPWGSVAKQAIQWEARNKFPAFSGAGYITG